MPAHFSGTPKIELLQGGVLVRLLEAFSFFDEQGEAWSVPAGAMSDGASIPGWLKSLIGGSFDGPYRSAAIIHDWYCDVRLREAAATHRAFYDAMTCTGENPVRARIMYFAVRKRGPRWNLQAVHNTRLAAGGGSASLMSLAASETVGAVAALAAAAQKRAASPPPSDFDQLEFDAVKARIESGDLDLEAIEAATPLD